MNRAQPPAASVALAGVLDVLLVLVFVLTGRGSHAEGVTVAGTAGTAWPFLAGLVVGWLVMQAWRSPRGVVWTGIGVWIATVVVGMLLRMASGQGTALSFVIVATLVLAALLLGWRGIAAAVTRRGRPASV
jgi:peptidoglycan/LPS O-acetylase OafA/YrhL